MERKSKNKETQAAPSQANGQGNEVEIRSLAYQLFCESGYQNGKDQEHWLEAERTVLGGTKTE